MREIVDGIWLAVKKTLDARTYLKLLNNLNDDTSMLPPGIFAYCEEDDGIYRLRVDGTWETFVTDAEFTGTLDVDSYLYNKNLDGTINKDDNIYIPTPKMNIHDDLEVWDWLHLAQPATADDILESDVMKTDKGWNSFDTYFKTVDVIQQGNEYTNSLVTEAMQPKFVVVNDLTEMKNPSELYLLSDGRQFGIYIYDKTSKKPVKLGDKEVNLALYATKVYANGILDNKILTEKKGKEGQLVTLDAALKIHFIDKYDLSKFLTEETINKEAAKYIDKIDPDGNEGQVLATKNDVQGLKLEFVDKPSKEEAIEVILKTNTQLTKDRYQKLINNQDDNTYTINPPTVKNSKKMFLYVAGSNNTTFTFPNSKMRNSDSSSYTMRSGYNYEFELNYIKEANSWVIDAHEFGSNCYFEIEVDSAKLFTFDPNAFIKDADDTNADVSSKLTKEITNIGIKYKLKDPNMRIAVNGNAQKEVTKAIFYNTILETVDIGGDGNILTEITFKNCKFVRSDMLSSMAMGNTSLTKVIFENPVTSPRITVLNDMFNGCTKLTNVAFSTLDTSDVTNMENMFSGCSALEFVDLFKFNTMSVTNMKNMFANCVELNSVNGLEAFDTEQVTDMYGMFYKNLKLNKVNLANFRTPNLINCDCMFEGDVKLKYIDVSNWDLDSVTSYENMFKDCVKFEYVNTRNCSVSTVNKLNAIMPK